MNTSSCSSGRQSCDQDIRDGSASCSAAPSAEGSEKKSTTVRDTLNLIAGGLRTGKIKAASVEMLLNDGIKRVSVLELVERALKECGDA